MHLGAASPVSCRVTVQRRVTSRRVVLLGACVVLLSLTDGLGGQYSWENWLNELVG